MSHWCSVPEMMPPLAPLIELCWQAHEVILPYWRSGDMAIECKDDNSPVTQADLKANHLIVERLRQLHPEIAVVSEEGTQQELATGSRFWLVDPLDGTKSFIKGRDEFTVNIALIENQRPVLGVMGVPAQGKLYYARKGEGAFRLAQKNANAERISVRLRESGQAVKVVASLAHQSPKLHAWLDSCGRSVEEFVGAGSALKFALVAEGQADLYPRLGPTMEWDTAAGHCLVEEAGGMMLNEQGKAFLYQKAGYLNGSFVVKGYRD